MQGVGIDYLPATASHGLGDRESRIGDPRKVRKLSPMGLESYVIHHLLGQIPYESPPRQRVMLPVREKRGGYRAVDHSRPYIPTVY